LVISFLFKESKIKQKKFSTKKHLAGLRITLNCPVNCPYLQIFTNTGNCICELGLRAPSITDMYQHLFKEEENEKQ